MSLNIDEIYDSLSKHGKDNWDIIQEEINRISIEENLTIKQINSLRERKMAEVKYADLQQENKQLSRSNDVLAKKKINKNTLKMREMDDVYKSVYQDVKKVEPKLNRNIKTALKNKNKTKNNNSK